MDNAAPARAAVMIMGIRDCRIMISQALLSLPFPVRIPAISRMGISTDPKTRHANASNTSSIANTMVVIT